MAANVSYQRVPTGTATVYPLGSASAPALLFGGENALGGLNDGVYATTGPAIGFSINGTSVLTLDSTGIASATAIASGAITSSGAILSTSATGGLGYATGAGGVVTQGTDKETGVTLNTVTGAITMNNAALGASALATFTVTNSAVGINDVVMVNHGSAGTLGPYAVQAHSITAGSFKISVFSHHGSSLSEAIVLNFAVLQGVAA